MIILSFARTDRVFQHGDDSNKGPCVYSTISCLGSMIKLSQLVASLSRRIVSKNLKQMRITKQDITELDLKGINSMTDTELEEFCESNKLSHFYTWLLPISTITFPKLLKFLMFRSFPMIHIWKLRQSAKRR